VVPGERKWRELPLWVMYPLLFVGVYLSHATLLRLPYFWDEAGYYIPAALDFFKTGTLIPYTTITNAHPPLPSVMLAAWWHIAGYVPSATRTLVCFVTAAALLAVFRMARMFAGTVVAACCVVLTAAYPIWYAQSTLAHADLLAAAFTLWGLACYLPDSSGGGAPCTAEAILCFTLAALSKETAICTPAALFAYETARLLRNHQRQAALRRMAWLLIPPILLSGWYLYHWRRTGFVFGNPQFLRYNAASTLAPLRILLALAHRTVQLTLHMNLFVPVLCACAALFLTPRLQQDGTLRPPLPRASLVPLLWVFLANLLFFSVLGGALLTRYLLPLYPLVLLVCVAEFWQRVPGWGALVALAAVAFGLGIFINPPYRFAPEDNLAYADMIHLQQDAIHVAVHRFPGEPIPTAWPATDELTRPELGYMKWPVAVVPIENFSLPEIERAATLPGYGVALIFSTKYAPARLPFSLGARNEALDRRYFDFHRDLSPEAVARLLGGQVVWREERKGQWAAVLHFDRPQQAHNGGACRGTVVTCAAEHAAL